jgi:DNA-binding NtrC family response regulator
MSALRILLLEDDRDDAVLIEQTIVQAGVECAVTLVQTEAIFIDALRRDEFDVILVDYSLPRFDGLSAIEEATRRRPETPLILVSGAIDEDLAIQTLKVGASDYVLKSRLDRLVPVIMRCLRESRFTRRLLRGIAQATADITRTVERLEADGDMKRSTVAGEQVRRLRESLKSLEGLLDPHDRPAGHS